MSDPISQFAEMLASVAGVSTSRQESPAERTHTFDSRHVLAHFLRDVLAEDIESMVRRTNMPQLLVGDTAGGHMELEASCHLPETGGVTWTLRYKGEMVLGFDMYMYPTENAPAE